MQEKKIMRGVVYGVAGRWDDEPRATVVLEASPRSIFVRRGNQIEQASVQDGRVSVGDVTGSGERGYAAVTGPADLLETVNCDLELDRLGKGLAPSAPGVNWTLVTRPAKVQGPYRDAARAYDEEQERVANAAAARKAQVDDAIGLLAGYGVPAAPGYHDATVTLAAAGVGQLLRADAADDAQVPRDGVAEDDIEEPGPYCFYCRQSIDIADDGNWQVPGAVDDADGGSCSPSPDGWHSPDEIHEDGTPIEEIERQERELAALDPATRAALDSTAEAPVIRDGSPDMIADAMRALHDGVLDLVPGPERDRAELRLTDLLHLSADDLSDEARHETARKALAAAAGRDGTQRNRAARARGTGSRTARGTRPGGPRT